MSLLVDAYNLLHAVPELREVLRRQGPRAACWALVDLLARWRAAQPKPPDLVLVFDGAAPLPRGPRIKGLQVRFVDSEADDDLKRLLERAGDHVLVSADGEIVLHAAKLGQRVIEPAAFMADVQLDLEAHAEVVLRDPGQLSEAEVTSWMETFGAASPGAEPATGPAAAPPPDAPPLLGDEEVQEWMEFFGGEP